MIGTVKRLKERLEHILTGQTEQLGRWGRFLRFQLRLWVACARRLRENNAMAMSAALSFRTIFALVPTLVLVFLVFKSVGAFDTKQTLRAFMDSAGLSQIVLTRERDEGASRPDAGQGAPEDQPPRRRPRERPSREQVTLAERLERLVGRVEEKLTLGRIGPVGVLLLIWAAVTLLTTVERYLNRIFEAPRSRSLGRRVLLYWSAVTLLPICLAGANYLAGTATAALTSFPAVSWLLRSAGWAGPVVVGVVLLASVYTLMPNTKVRFRAALAGAVVAIPLWMLAKWGFAQYVHLTVSRPSIYGALGIIPLFLIWLNLTWLIFLFAAEIAHTVSDVRRLRLSPGESVMLGPWDMLAAAVAVARVYQAGGGPVSLPEVAAKLRLPEEAVRSMLERLGAAEIVCAVQAGAGEGYVLARPAERIALSAIFAPRRSGRDAGEAREYDDDISSAVNDIRRLAGSVLESATLAEVLSERSDADRKTIEN